MQGEKEEEYEGENFLTAILVFLLTFLSLRGTQAQTKEEKTMEIKSTALKQGGTIPAKHACDGADVSPPLEWRYKR